MTPSSLDDLLVSLTLDLIKPHSQSLLAAMHFRSKFPIKVTVYTATCWPAQLQNHLPLLAFFNVSNLIDVKLEPEWFCAFTEDLNTFSFNIVLPIDYCICMFEVLMFSKFQIYCIYPFVATVPHPFLYVLRVGNFQTWCLQPGVVYRMHPLL